MKLKKAGKSNIRKLMKALKKIQQNSEKQFDKFKSKTKKRG